MLHVRHIVRVSLRTVRIAAHALCRNVMRSTLTCLGIIIGIAAVIAMMEIGNGAAKEIQGKIAAMGANIVNIYPGIASPSGVSYGYGSVMTLKPADCEAILRDCGTIKFVAPLVWFRATVLYADRNWVPTGQLGTTPSYLSVRDWDLTEGNPFTDQDVRSAAKVCLLGQTSANGLFDTESPIGKEIRVQNVPLKVVGVLSRKGTDINGRDQDDVMLVPWTTVKYRITGNSSQTANQSAAGSDLGAVNSLSSIYPNSSQNLYDIPAANQLADTPLPVKFINVNSISAGAASIADVPQAIREITDLLHERHHIKEGRPDDFIIRDMTEMINNATSTSTAMTNLLLAVALISLVVGGVGIMNIMLVSVTERTREIGLRMAVGARGSDILAQFLVEAVSLCLLGGLIGILLGRGVSFLAHKIKGYPTATSVTAIVAAVVVSAMVGVAFGFYPAWKASRLDPIEALRYE